MTKHDAEQYALGAAGIVIIALTAGAFWLSYAHLADVAGQHGLGTSPIRRWAWPATLDAFIVAGELLMLRAGLRQVTDKSAIAVTAIGSGSSIALNVAGVSGTGNTDTVPFLDYVVAAVPRPPRKSATWKRPAPPGTKRSTTTPWSSPAAPTTGSKPCSASSAPT
ncbi:DUF2637 domain-containing protein [Streptomyces sp. NPDC001709]